MDIKMPEGKFMSTVKVGEKGQIVIPKEARDMFGIRPGDMLLLMADQKQGIAITGSAEYLRFAEQVFSGEAAREDGTE